MVQYLIDWEGGGGRRWAIDCYLMVGTSYYATDEWGSTFFQEAVKGENPKARQWIVAWRIYLGARADGELTV